MFQNMTPQFSFLLEIFSNVSDKEHICFKLLTILLFVKRGVMEEEPLKQLM